MPGVARRYPQAERLDLTETRHSRAVSDPYRWLEDPADRRTVSWLAAQEDLFAAERDGWPVEHWRRSLAPLATSDTVSAPTVRLDKVFYLRRRADDDHPTLVVVQDGEERPLVDPHALDPSGQTMLDAWRPSVEGDLVAYQISVGGTEDSCLWVMDIATGKIVDGPIDRVRSTRIGWLPGGTHYFYVRWLAPELHPGDHGYHRRVFLHQVGTDPAEDVMIFGEGRGKTQHYVADVTADGRWLTISATTGTDPSTDIWLADLRQSPWHAPELRPVQENVAARTRLIIGPGTGPDDPMWLLTTEGAPWGRVATVTAAALDGPRKELIAERPGAVLADFAVLTSPELPSARAVVAWTRHAVGEITVHELADGRERERLELPGVGSISAIGAHRDAGYDAWFSYGDFCTLPTVLRYDGRTGEVRPWFFDEMTTDREGIRACQVSFESRDGTTVRMFVISPEGRPDRPRPAILTGYGGFGSSLTPGYSSQVLAWVRAGGVYAIAGLRGGGEEGEAWHLAGRRENKQNVFDDFDAAADHLLEAGWTDRERLGILGGSNGGLLVGAALTQHPEKYAAVVCLDPLLDMVRYELFGRGPSWRREYGSADDPAEFDVLLSYSPYHHVDHGTAYPAVLFGVAEGDTRVDPLHAEKMCAALQHASSGRGPILLRYERGAGHGKRPKSLLINRDADCLAFFAHHLGLEEPGSVVNVLR